MNSTPYKNFERAALDAGVSAELAFDMYNVIRDAQEHQWMEPIRRWTGNEQNLIALALEEPDRMSEACLLLMSSDGLIFDEGQRLAGIDEKKRSEIEKWIFASAREAIHDALQ